MAIARARALLAKTSGRICFGLHRRLILVPCSRQSDPWLAMVVVVSLLLTYYDWFPSYRLMHPRVSRRLAAEIEISGLTGLYLSSAEPEDAI